MPLELFEETLQQSAGWMSNRERGRRFTDQQLLSVQELVYNGRYQGRNLLSHERTYLLQEALTTSDFPLMFGDVLQRQMLANYKAVDPVWKAFTKLSTNNDFKPSYRFAIAGGDDALVEVSEKGEYLASPRTETKYTLTVKKYGKQFDISWEAIVNDDLGALQDTPQRFAMASIRMEHRRVTNLYADDDGTHAGGELYEKAAGVNTNGSTALLTIANLEAGLEAMAGFVDANGEPIVNRAKFLVVPPALEMTGRQILTSATKMWVELGGAGGPLPYPTTNVVAQMGLTLVIDPYLPIMDTTNGNTAWYLFADPNDIAVLEAAHLRGHENPEIVMKASDKVALGGGAPLNPMSGDFATDNVFYRVRQVFGETKLDWRGTYAGGLVS